MNMYKFNSAFLCQVLGVLLVFLLSLSSNELYAQAEEFVRVETTEGNVFIGHLIAEDEQSITLRVDSVGEIRIERRNILSISSISSDKIRDGKYWYPNPQSTRYFFAPNAIGIRKGEGYYQNAWILFNNVNYGITNRFSLGGGMVPMFLFGSPGTPVWLLPKLTFPLSDDHFHLGAGAMVGGLVGVDSELGGLVYGVGTLGNRDKNLTIGIGYGFVGDEVAKQPLINVSGMIRTGRRLYLISENYFVTESGVQGIISFGARWTSESIATDFGLFMPLEDTGSFIGLPWLGVTIPFGRD